MLSSSSRIRTSLWGLLHLSPFDPGKSFGGEGKDGLMHHLFAVMWWRSYPLPSTSYRETSWPHYLFEQLG